MAEKKIENGKVRYSAAYPTGREFCDGPYHIDRITRVCPSRPLKKLYALAINCALILLLSGCVHLDLSSAADCDENSKMQFRDVTSAYGWDWGDSAQKMLDERLQGADGRVDERAVQRIVVSQKWWEVLATWGSLGIAKPVELTLWLEEAQ